MERIEREKMAFAFDFINFRILSRYLKYLKNVWGKEMFSKFRLMVSLTVEYTFSDLKAKMSKTALGG